MTEFVQKLLNAFAVRVGFSTNDQLQDAPVRPGLGCGFGGCGDFSAGHLIYHSSIVVHCGLTQDYGVGNCDMAVV